MRIDNEEYCEIWERKLEEQQRYVDEIRAIKHDMQAHLIVLQYYLDAKMYKEANLYLKKMREVEWVARQGIEADTGNPLVNAVIEDYLKRDPEIKLYCSGKIAREIHVTAFDFCVLFSNIMSNAVEACARLTQTAKVISIKMKEDNDIFEIVVENPTEWKIEEDILGNGSTKIDAQRHGYGIKNMKSVVETYEGKLKFEILENIFRVKIQLPVEKK